MWKCGGLLILLLSVSPKLCAQRQYNYDEEVPRYELGAQFDFNRLTGVGAPGGTIGARVHFNFDEHFALDAELTHRTHVLVLPAGTQAKPVIGQTNGLFGLRVGVRAYSGMFLHARGGFVNFGAQDGNSLLTRRTFPAAEFGGTVENYAGPFIFRFDVGGMIIPYGSATVSPAFSGLPSSAPRRPLGTRATSLVGVGVAIRF